MPTPGSSGAALYTGVAPDGGLIVNPSYVTATIGSGTTLDPSKYHFGKPFTSGLLYGSSVVSPSSTPNTYSLTFTQPGDYVYEIPFQTGDNLGEFTVVP